MGCQTVVLLEGKRLSHYDGSSFLRCCEDWCKNPLTVMHFDVAALAAFYNCFVI